MGEVHYKMEIFLSKSNQFHELMATDAKDFETGEHLILDSLVISYTGVLVRCNSLHPMGMSMLLAKDLDCCS
ncbi:hypothetical protein BDL97_14G041500 [Sphagnum fallax]|nr:hypothetical protein BDL97_14G041500 [Sphagnum fallax]